MLKRKPHLRFAVTPNCNFSCNYCRPGGEGIETNEIMTLDEMIKILEIASNVGFKHVKITGGEPLLREKNLGDVIPLIESISASKYFDDIQLVTNGALLSDYAYQLAKSGLNSITVSLDTADPEKFKEITGRNKFYVVLEGIGKVRAYGLPVTINSVIFKQNIDEMPDLIKIAERFHTRLKLLDYIDVGSEKNNWDNNYAPFDKVGDYLKNIRIKEKILLPPGGLGTPMPTYTLKSGIDVLVKDSSVGTNYNTICESCKNYPCQDALISLRITANASLKRCLIRDDNLIETLDDLRNKDYNSVKSKIQESFVLLMSARYVENAWKPK